MGNYRQSIQILLKSLKIKNQVLGLKECLKKPVDRILNSENILKTRLESLNNSKTIRELISKFNFRSFEKNLEILREFVSNKTNQSHKNYQEIVELTQDVIYC